MTLKSLNDSALDWKRYIKDVEFVVVQKSLDLHQPGLHSLYEVDFVLFGDEIHLFKYIGTTSRKKIAQRLNEHLSEFKNVRVTTFNSKSKMFNMRYMRGLRQVNIHFNVIEGGLAPDAAKHKEKAVSNEMKRLFGDYVLTDPTGKKIID